MKNKIIYSIIALVLIVCVAGYIVYGYYNKVTFEQKNPIVTMEIEGYGTVKMELYPDKAPNTVKNFIKLINEGYYNGLVFHRVEADLLIQGGDEVGDGSGTNEYSVKGEFAANGYKGNNLKFEKGTVRISKTRLFFLCKYKFCFN